jgi:polar amino acid transport system substrate-binding protein/glutamate/aspartate transport system substrate-binding protein
MAPWIALLLLLAIPAQAEVLSRVADNGVLRVGVRTDAAPLSYVAEGGKAAGYAVAVCERLAQRVAEQTGLNQIIVQHVPLEADTRYQAVADEQVDILCGAESVTLGRRELVDFSIPIYVDGASVMMRRGETAEFAMLAGRRIGVRAGTTTERSLIATLDRAGMTADVVIVAEHPEGLARLIARDIDAYFADQSILFSLVAGSGVPQDLAVLSNVLTVEPQALALPRGDSAFRLEVDRALSRMYREGEIARIFEAAFSPATMGDAMRALTVLAPLPE